MGTVADAAKTHLIATVVGGHTQVGDDYQGVSSPSSACAPPTEGPGDLRTGLWLSIARDDSQLLVLGMGFARRPITHRRVGAIVIALSNSGPAA